MDPPAGVQQQGGADPDEPSEQQILDFIEAMQQSGQAVPPDLEVGS